MAQVNVTTIGGRLVAAPETKQYGDTIVTTFSIAHNPSKNAEVEYFDVTGFGEGASKICGALVKGQEVTVSGRSRQQSWTKDGVKHYNVDIVGETFQPGRLPKDAEAAA